MALTLSGNGAISGPLNLNTTNAVSIANTLSFGDSTQMSTTNSLGPRNRIINGDFKIFQRSATATTVTLNGVGYTGPDRFFVYQNGTAGVQTTQVASGLTGFQYALKWGRPVSNTTTGVTVLGQALETINSVDLQGQSVTLSFWAKAGANFSAASSQIYVALYTGTGTDQSAANMTTGSWTGSATPISATATLTTSWQRFSFTATLGSTVTQTGVYINWSPVGTAGADDNVYITGVQLEQGSVATPFERRSYGIELALCQRYFLSYSGNNQNICCGSDNGNAGAQGNVVFPVTMRVVPTASVSSVSHFSWYASKSATIVVLSSITHWNLSTTGDVFVFTVGNQGVGVPYSVYINTASGYLWYNAEL